MYITLSGILFYCVVLIQFGSIFLNTFYIARQQFISQQKIFSCAKNSPNRNDSTTAASTSSTASTTGHRRIITSFDRRQYDAATKRQITSSHVKCLVNFDTLEPRLCNWYTSSPIDTSNVGNGLLGDTIYYSNSQDSHGCFKVDAECNNYTYTKYILFRDFAHACPKFERIGHNTYTCSRLGINVYSTRRFKIIIGASNITRMQTFWSQTRQQIIDTEQFIRAVDGEPFAFIYLNISFHSHSEWNTVGGGDVWLSTTRRPVGCLMRIQKGHGLLIKDFNTSIAAHELLHCLCMDSNNALWTSMHRQQFDTASNSSFMTFIGQRTRAFLHGQPLLYKSKNIAHFHFVANQSHLDGFPSTDPYQSWSKYRREHFGRPFSPLVRHVLTDYGYEIDDWKFYNTKKRI